MQTGEGIQKYENSADILYGSPLSWISIIDHTSKFTQNFDKQFTDC